MPDVSTSVLLGDFEPCDVWPILSDFARYPDFMTDVLEVTVSPEQAEYVTSTWRVLINGSELTWTEQDWLTTDQRIKFEQTDGDLEVWHGEWLLTKRADGLYVDLNVTFDLGIPSLAEVLHPIGERAIRANNIQMLDGIRDQLLARLEQRAYAGGR